LTNIVCWEASLENDRATKAQASSGIENVITTQDKLYQALYAKSAKHDVATKEVLRYREALLMGTLLIKEKGFLNTNGIIAIQKELP